jgi:signal transduction histidine kinase
VVSRSFEEARSGKSGSLIETQVMTQDKRILDVSVKVTVIELNGRKVVLGSFRDVTAWKLAEQKLATSYSKLQQLALHLDKVREEERTRIAREIHDEMGATLTALKMSVHWLASKLPAEMKQFVTEAKSMDKLVSNMIHTMRHVVSQLMPTQLHDMGFATAVEHYVRDFQKQTGMDCRLALPETEVTLEENQSSTLFRILQESLNNIAKHAQATSVAILFIKRKQSFTMVIKDNGTGFDRNANKDNTFGLFGIRERALMINGKARISSRPGKGTQVLIRIRPATMLTEDKG